MQPWQTWLFVGLDALVALLLLLFGFRSLRRKRTIENVPTSKAKGVFMGFIELKGRSECDRPLRSYLAEVECVYFSWKVEEEWEKTEWKTETDSNGNTTTKKETESGWETLASGEERSLFFARDDTGAVRIDPAKAEMDAETTVSATHSRLHPMYYAKGPVTAIAHSTGRRRFHERVVRNDADLYILGTARLRQDAVEPEIAFDKDEECFLVSVRGEEEIKRGLAWKSTFQLLVGVLFAAAAPWIYGVCVTRDAGRGAELMLPTIMIAAIAYAAGIFVFYLTLINNGLVSVKNRLKNAWSLIDIELKRRFDLIPGLVACVQGFAKHEASVQTEIAKIRVEGTQGGAPAFGVAGQAMALAGFANAQTGALRSLYNFVERYPDLKADASFRRLMKTLADTEDRIALARTFYNQSVTAYNDRIATLPDVMIAKVRGLGEVEWLKIDEFERRPIDVGAAMATKTA